MKETINISIAGISFVIEKDAQTKLSSYIEVVKNRLKGHGNDGEEIIADIEARIAEILLSKRQTVSEPITVECIDEVIAQMGMPEMVEDEPNVDGFDYEKEIGKDEVVSGLKRRLYRNLDGATLGGVLNGLATYFALDIVWLRIAVVLFFVIGVIFKGIIIPYMALTYIILWIIIPSAKTALQKLEMEGKNATISNIETKYKDEQSYQYKKQINNSLNFFGKILKGILVVFVGCLLLGMVGVFVGVIVLVAGAFSVPSFLAPLLIWNMHLTIVAASLGLIIPCVVITAIFIGMIRSNVNIPRWFYTVCGILWLVSLIVLGVSAFKNIYTRHSSDSISKTIYSSAKTDRLYLTYMNDSQVKKLLNSDLYSFNNTIIDEDNNLNIYCHDTYDSVMKVVFTLTANGINKDDAITHAEDIVVPYTINGDTICISPRFRMRENKYYKQRVSVDIYVPVQKDVVAIDYQKIRFWNGEENEDMSVYRNNNYSTYDIDNDKTEPVEDKVKVEASISISSSTKIKDTADVKPKIIL